MADKPDNKIQITVTDMRLPAWCRGVATMTMIIFAPIAVGIFTASSAMQWAGFVMGILSLMAWAKNKNTDTRFTSITAARAYLDKLEGEKNNG